MRDSLLCKHLSWVCTAGCWFVASFHTQRTAATCVFVCVCVCWVNQLRVLQLSPICVLLMERLLCKE